MAETSGETWRFRICSQGRERVRAEHVYYQCIGYIVERRANAARLLFHVIRMLGVMTRIRPFRESGETRAEADKLWTLRPEFGMVVSSI
jgi:hypothetical protein